LINFIFTIFATVASATRNGVSDKEGLRHIGVGDVSTAQNGWQA
jgi:hypothetical protein